MQVFSREVDGTTVLRIAGRLDTATAPDFDQDCEGRTEAGARRIVVDLAELEYVSSAGLRSFLALAKRLSAAGGELRLCGARGLVDEVLVASGIPDLLPTFATLDDALGEES